MYMHIWCSTFIRTGQRRPGFKCIHRCTTYAYVYACIYISIYGACIYEYIYICIYGAKPLL